MAGATEDLEAEGGRGARCGGLEGEAEIQKTSPRSNEREKAGHSLVGAENWRRGTGDGAVVAGKFMA